MSQLGVGLRHSPHGRLGEAPAPRCQGPSRSTTSRGETRSRARPARRARRPARHERAAEPRTSRAGRSRDLRTEKTQGMARSVAIVTRGRSPVRARAAGRALIPPGLPAPRWAWRPEERLEARAPRPSPKTARKLSQLVDHGAPAIHAPWTAASWSGEDASSTALASRSRRAKARSGGWRSAPSSSTSPCSVSLRWPRRTPARAETTAGHRPAAAPDGATAAMEDREPHTVLRSHRGQRRLRW